MLLYHTLTDNIPSLSTVMTNGQEKNSPKCGPCHGRPRSTHPGPGSTNLLRGPRMLGIAVARAAAVAGPERLVEVTLRGWGYEEGLGCSPVRQTALARQK